MKFQGENYSYEAEIVSSMELEKPPHSELELIFDDGDTRIFVKEFVHIHTAIGFGVSPIIIKCKDKNWETLDLGEMEGYDQPTYYH